ncbi:MAG: ABC transporter ATP-binding protein [Hyphomicrobiaceae bacterium]
MTPTPVLAVEGARAGYAEDAIVRDLDCVLAEATVTCLIGANGAGKSTFLKYLYGLVRHMGGRVLYRGDEIQTLPPEARLARGIALVPQGRCNFQDMTVRENLWLGAYTLPRRRAVDAIEQQVAEFPVLRRKWTELAGNLSGGEQQILEMSMALLVAPRLLLLDEPSLGLSPKMMAEIFAVIRGVAAAGVTVAMVEQNVHSALAIADNVLVMDLGRKIFEGPPDAILADPRIKAAYLGGV